MKRKDIFYGLAIVLISLLFILPFSSSLPDGLERVAHDLGFVANSEQSVLLGSPLSGYHFPGIKNEVAGGVLAGILGTLLMFGIGCCLALLLRKIKERK